MTSPADLSSPTNAERAARYERVAADFDHLLRAVPDDRWDAASPCEGWTARDVVSHVIDTQRDLMERMGFDTPDLTGLEPIAAWDRIRAAMSAAMADPGKVGHEYDGWFGPTTFGRTVDDFYSFDLVIHRWDVARAAGLGEHQRIDDDLIDWLRSRADGFGDALRMPGICADAVPVPDEASAQDRLLAWLGRDPR